MGKKRKRKGKFTREEMIMFGKMCGCEKCRFCAAWDEERQWVNMVEIVEKGKQTAEKHREEIKKGWLWK